MYGKRSKGLILGLNPRMQNDVEHFKSKMSKIGGSGDLGDQLLELVKAKKTVATPEREKETGPTAKTSEKEAPKS